MLQFINPNLKAVLVQVQDIQWHNTFQDEQRTKYHNEKMRSKDERPASHMSALGNVPDGYVLHVTDTCTKKQL